jgi:hypothetical protein
MYMASEVVADITDWSQPRTELVDELGQGRHLAMALSMMKSIEVAVREAINHGGRWHLESLHLMGRGVNDPGNIFRGRCLVFITRSRVSIFITCCSSSRTY